MPTDPKPNKTEEILPHAVYTTSEAEKILKVSNSTMKRLIKRGILKANKVGKQYRILGLELLRLVSPELEKKAVDKYLKLKMKAIDVMKDWDA